MPPQRFAHTKIQPPRPRPGVVARPRLDAPLDAALDQQRCVLLCAPAGFGKTVALTQRLAARPQGTALAWVAADADDDLARFLSCLVAALEPYDLPWRTSPDALIAGIGDGREARRAAAFELVNALLATPVPRGLIVLEDAHRLTDAALFEFVELVIERLPQAWGFVIASRVDPPLPLARWRARGELAEFRQEALRFTADEVERWLAALPAAPLGADTEALIERTAGWAAGLRLVLGGPRDAHATRESTSQRHLFEYLAAEVLDEMPEDLRRFLLRSSVLAELSATRCAAVTGMVDAARLLEAVEQRGLFVSVLDDLDARDAREERGDRHGEHALRLHDLFREFLEDRLKREEPLELPRLLERAADTEPDPVRRVYQLAQAGLWPRAETVLDELGPGLLAEGGAQQVLRLIDLFPSGWLERSARLSHLRGLAAWAHWDLVTMGRSLEAAAAGFEHAGEAVRAQRARVLAVIGMTAGGAVPRAIELLAEVRRRPMDAHTETTALQAEIWHRLAAMRGDTLAEPLARLVDLLERSADPMLWFQTAPTANMLGLPGTREPLRRYVEGALKRSPAETPTALGLIARALEGGLALWAGRLDAANDILRRAEHDARWLGRPPNVVGPLQSIAALTHAARGDAQAALAASDQRIADLVGDERTSGRRAVWINHFQFFKLRVAGALDDAATVREVAATLAASPNPTEHPLLVAERSTLPARLAELDGRWADAADGYAAALEQPQQIALYGQADEVRMRLAHALLRLDRFAEGAAALAPLVENRARAGEPGGVLLAGRATLGRLAATHWTGHLSAGGVALLRHWASLLGAAPQLVPVALPAVLPPVASILPAALPEPAAPAAEASSPGGLSSREREVLQRLAAGDSNKLIARALDLSPHTVKRHVANILDKLALQSRGQAAAWFRQN